MKQRAASTTWKKRRPRGRTFTTPHQLAVGVADQWFRNLTTANDGLIGESDLQFDETVDRIAAAIRQTYMDVDPDFVGRDGAPVDLREFAGEAGYLIGVQIGLRLRAVGGAR